MPTAEARVQTEQPGRYLAQLCQHAGKIGRHLSHRPRAHASGGTPPEIYDAQCTSTAGLVTLNWGQWTMHAAPGALILRAEAADQDSLRHIQDLLTARLEKIGRRDNLTVSWQPSETLGDRTE